MAERIGWRDVTANRHARVRSILARQSTGGSNFPHAATTEQGYHGGTDPHDFDDRPGESMTFLLFLVFLAACVAAGATGALFAPGEWYRTLRKPGWTPPGWVFSAMWTSLYLLMAWAAARVAAIEGNGPALALWALQIALNALWTPVFFGLHRVRAGLAIIMLLWVVVLSMTLAFFRLDPLAGAMLLPYLAWISVATALNHAIMRLNPDRIGAVTGDRTRD